MPDPSYTKSFCIRGLRLPPAMKTETVIAPAARRKKIYLPPPLETDRKHLPPSSPTNSDVNAYPSPSTLSSKPLLASISQAKRNDDYTPPRSRPGVGVVTPYRPPSPPPSDFPIPSDADMRVEIDEEGIKVGHPEITRLLRKVLWPFVFDLNILICYGSADARVLICGTCWDLIVAVLCEKMLIKKNKMNKWKFR